MSMIKSIKIENFRQFDKLEIDNFKRVNFLVGKNNCGKTTLLEALFLASYPIDINSLKTIYNFRKMGLSQELVSTLFFRKDENKAININIKTVDESNYGFMMKLKEYENDNQKIEYENDNQKKSVDKIYDYIAIDNADEYKCTFIATLNEISLKRTGMMPELPQQFGVFTLYISNEMKSISTDRLNNSISESREGELLKYLKIFEPKISWIGFGNNNTILVEIEEDNKKYKLPLNLMGDGFFRFLSILVDILYEKNYNHVVLIDEIENGLHYTNIKNLIRAILKLSKEMNIQMFITTHSYETLKFLSEIVEEDEFKTEQEDVQVINIAKTKLNGFKSYNYSMEGLINLIETETEIRK